MSDPQQLAPLLLLAFVIQPILLGICVRKVHHRSGLLWGLLSFAADVGIPVFFEMHMPAHTMDDMTA